MKVRQGFVSNSSSSSFIIKKQDERDLPVEFPFNLVNISYDNVCKYVLDNLEDRISHAYDEYFMEDDKWFEIWFETGNILQHLPQCLFDYVYYDEYERNCVGGYGFISDYNKFKKAFFDMMNNQIKKYANGGFVKCEAQDCEYVYLNCGLTLSEEEYVKLFLKNNWNQKHFGMIGCNH